MARRGAVRKTRVRLSHRLLDERSRRLERQLVLLHDEQAQLVHALCVALTRLADARMAAAATRGR